MKMEDHTPKQWAARLLALGRTLLMLMALVMGTTANANKIYSQPYHVQDGSSPPLTQDKLIEGFHGEAEALAACAVFEAPLPPHPWAQCGVGPVGSPWPNLYWAHVGWVTVGPNSWWYAGFFCINGTRYIPPTSEADNGWCAPVINRMHSPPAGCSADGAGGGSNSPGVGNPIQPMTGAKTQRVLLGDWLGDRFEIVYDTQYLIAPNITGIPLYPAAQPSFGGVWQSSHHRRAHGDWTNGTLRSMKVQIGGGAWRTFERDTSTGIFSSTSAGPDRLVAHRLYLVEDHRGNSIEYELDNLGNRKVEKVKGFEGVLRRQLDRDIDALGRIEKITGRE